MCCVSLLAGALATAQALASGTLVYNATNFVERWQNDGGVVSPIASGSGGNYAYITVALTNANDTFAGANGQDFVALGYVVPTNVPPGLTAMAIRAATNQVLLSLTGYAVSHTTNANINNLAFIFTNSAFTSGSAAAITWAGGTNLSVVFLSQNPSNWYVSATGSDASNGTSSASAFLTLSKAVGVSQSAANDVITMGTGTWTVAEQIINKPITIIGAGKTLTILQATNAPLTAANKRILITNKQLILRQMTLQNANTSSGNVSGGAVNNYGLNGYLDWTFDSCRFLNNTATNTAATANGGAIYVFNNGGATSPWKAVNCDFIGNRSDFGGAIWSGSQSINFTNCLFINNHSTMDGGAVYVNPGTTGSFVNCQMLTNSAGRSGGAVYQNAAGPNQISGCTFANNSAVTAGGAIDAWNTTTAGILYSSDTTFYANTAGLGGAFYGQNSWGPAGTFYGCTFVNNSAQTGGAFRLENSSTAVGLHSCIVAGNSAAVAGPDLSYGNNTGTAGFNPVSNSLITASSGALPSAYLATRTNALGVVITNANFNYVGSNGFAVVNALRLSGLQNWGGPTPTCKPLAGNPTIDHGSNPLGLVYDQRGPGFARVSGAAADMGAYETGSGPAQFVYSATAFLEATANDGSIGTTNQITLDEGIDSFTGANGDDFVAAGKLVVSNYPSGLTVVATRISATNLSVTLAGNAPANNASNSVYNMTFVFQTNALASGVVSSSLNYAVTNLQVLFNDNVNPSLGYSSSTFYESAPLNNGSISNAIIITLNNDTFTGANGDDFVAGNKVSVTNVPPGLTAVVTRQDPKHLAATLSGNATAHNAANSIANLTFAFTNTAFALNNAAIVTNDVVSNLQVQFVNPALSYTPPKTFNESWMNDGSIANTLSASLLGDTFNGTVGEDLVASGKVTPVNLPAGLMAAVKVQGPMALSIALLGNAVNSASYQNVTNLGFTFANNAFAGNTAAIVTNYNESDLAVAFLSQNATNWYVSTSGVDTNAYNGAITQPFRTVGYALTRIQSGANDTIHLLPGTYAESNLTISANLTITGNTRDDTFLQPWPTPFAAPNLTIFGIAANVTLKNLTLRYANASGSGAAIGSGSLTSIITVDGCRLTQNASAGGGGAIGWVNNTPGAGQLNVRNTEISYNQAVGGGGGIWDNMSSMTISNCVFVGNNGNPVAMNANAGGAILLGNAFPLTIWTSSFVSNSAANAGGVCAINNGAAVNVYNSTFAFNTATNSGGGFTDSQNAPTFVNCTFYGNTAANGGAMNVFNNGGGTVSLYNTTVFSNSAWVSGGGIYEYQQTYLGSTILAGNVAPLGPDFYRADTSGNVDSYSLIGNNANNLFAAGMTNANGSYVGASTNVINALLLPLANNGGPTLTCALQAGSLAIHHGSNPLALTTDQRGAGYVRQTGMAVDMGAFEYGSHLPIVGTAIFIQ